MPGTSISTSPNVAVFDMKIVADLCAGQFCLDVTPSIWIGGDVGKNNVQGVKFKIVDPYGVEIKPYPSSSFDLSPALSADMDSSSCFNVPTMASNYKYGKYTMTAELTDQDGTKYYNTKSVTICAPNSKDVTKPYGSLSARIWGNCKDGKVFIITDTVPNYNGRMVESQVNAFTLLYPTASGLAPLETTYGQFSVQLYEGQYMWSGEICATYNFEDSVYIKINYRIKKEHTVRCLIDECCVNDKLIELNARLRSGCSANETEKISNTILDALNLLKLIELAGACGTDAGTYIADLETLLGCVCTCNCAVGTPIINNSPSKDFIISGCNVNKESVGLTDVYTIDNFEYVVGVVENGGALVISQAVQEGCTRTQQITFNISAVYSQIKGLANSTLDEAVFWTTLVNKVLSLVDGSCINPAWASMTYSARMAAIVNNLCACCACAATINSSSVTKIGADVKLEWTDAGEFAVDVYLDGVFMGRVLSSVNEFTFVGAADGIEHTWVLVPICSNNKFGVSATDTFAELGCPSITPPSVSSSYVNDSCPYDLTTLLSAPPVGITYEWHTQNNTSSASLMGDPTNAISGVYYVFAKDADGCYSSGTQVTLVCVEATSCTAPQLLQVQQYLSSFRVMFSSAGSPPPGNSYTVKRRLASDPDVDPSYTTIGTPTFDSGLNKWTIIDSTAVNNTLYVYKAISNCGGSPPSTPFTTVEFANMTCPSLTLTPTDTEIGYSFSHAGGQVDKYDVQLYDSTGTILIDTITHTPAFPSPITDSFTGLSAATSYRIRIISYIGTTTKTCSMVSVSTGSAPSGIVNWFMNGYIGARLIISDDQSPPVEILNELSTLSPKSGTLSALTGSVTICAQWFSGSGNTIKIRICDSNGNEVYYHGNINIGDPEHCYTITGLPSSGSPYYVYVTAGDIEPATCS